MSSSYEDILTLPRPCSFLRTPMQRTDRAAQFAPFSALSGYEEEIKESSRITQNRIVLDDHSREFLDAKQQLLMQQAALHPRITVLHFAPDARKAGGAYIQSSGNLKNIDFYQRILQFTDGRSIPLELIDDILLSEPITRD